MKIPDWGSPGKWLYTDPERPPARTVSMMTHGQVWAWMNGPGGGHWEVRGTGVVI